MSVCTKCGGSVNHTACAAEVRRRMDQGIGSTARLFKGSNGSKLGTSYGAGEVALVGFTADLSDFSEVRLSPAEAFELAEWLVGAAEASERDAAFAPLLERARKAMLAIKGGGK